MGRRDKEDPVLTEFVLERLAHLLAENRPRRASPADAPQGTGSGRHEVRSERSTPPLDRTPVVFERATAALVRDAATGVPDFEPSDDGEGDIDVGSKRRHRVERASEPPPIHASGPVAVFGDDWPEAPARRSFGRAHVGVICALLLIGLLSASWAVLRARPVAIASTAPSPSLPSQLRSPAAPTTTSPTPSMIMVHVLGAVRKPGVVTLAEHSRVRDAIESAGGLRREAAPADLNLAQVLSDGQQVLIGTRKQPTGEVRDGTGGGDSASGTASGDTGGTVNLNSASQTQLEGLPGVGPVTAAKIIAWRDEHSRFSRVEELQEVDGIGPKTFAEIAPHVRV